LYFKKEIQKRRQEMSKLVTAVTRLAFLLAASLTLVMFCYCTLFLRYFEYEFFSLKNLVELLYLCFCSESSANKKLDLDRTLTFIFVSKMENNALFMKIFKSLFFTILQRESQRH
jgi:hypothetical protein